MTVSSAASLVGTTAVAQSTQAVTNTAINDLWIVFVVVRSATVTTTGVSCTNTGTFTQLDGPWLDSSSTAGSESIWMGKMTATGASTVTATFSGSVAAITVTIDAHPFHSTLGSPVWTLDKHNHQHNTASTTVAFPPLTATNASGTEFYWGHARVPSSASTPLPSGTVAVNDSNGDPEIYDVAFTGSLSPTMTQTSGISDTISVIVSESSFAVVPPLIAQQNAINRAATW